MVHYYSFEVRQVRSHLYLIRHPGPRNSRYVRKTKDPIEVLKEISKLGSVSEMISRIEDYVIELGEDDMNIKRAKALVAERNAEKRRFLENLKQTLLRKMNDQG